MQPCSSSSVAILLYLDEELADPERKALESHLCVCQGCRETADGERRFREELRSDAPLYQAPDKLRSRVEEIVREAAVLKAPAHLRSRVSEILG
jgi:anti-sigma factor RsiW